MTGCAGFVVALHSAVAQTVEPFAVRLGIDTGRRRLTRWSLSAVGLCDSRRTESRKAYLDIQLMGTTSLERMLSRYDSMLVGFSGGVDSALLSVVARRAFGKEKSVAAVGTSPSLPSLQLDQARRIAADFDLRLVEVPTSEIDDPRYSENSRHRCYYCKRELWSRLVGVASELGMSVVAEGTISEDLGEHRPGLQAAAEFDIKRPLADAGYDKEMVRVEARDLGIPIWNAPAAPCLSSRLLYGLEVTPQRLYQVESGESLLRELGVKGDMRVRHRGDEARLEVANSEFDKVRHNKARIVAEFSKLGFAHVTLDLSGYRRGSLLKNGAPVFERLS